MCCGGERVWGRSRYFLSLWVLTVFAEAAYLCGEGEWNRPLYDRLSRYGHLNVVMGWGSAYDGAVAQYLGLLSAAMDCVCCVRASTKCTG